ncbi:MAG: phosphoesterase [Acidobacteria bacterium]|nr:phosphoesterase [Acidobacteriota bacterium]
MRVHVFFHDRCFDGAASAAVFTRLFREAIHPGTEFVYSGLAHRASQLFDESLFDGDENAIVDFKYSTSPRLDWWFDHHQSAFLSPEDAVHFRADKSGKKFYDPHFKSCTQLIASVGKERFGFVAPDLQELVRWADIVDGALFPDAETAVQMKAPALRLALVMEAGKDTHLAQWLIPQLTHRSLEEIVTEERITSQFAPLFAQHLRSQEIIRQLGKFDQGVLFFDLTGPQVEVYNKFAPYYLFPECVYAVSICPSSFRTKISVGSNPWNKAPVLHNLATICERYGGGGHPRVGAISLEPGMLDRARQIAQEIVAELKTPPPPNDIQ